MPGSEPASQSAGGHYPGNEYSILPCASDENPNEINEFCSFLAMFRSFNFATHCANEVELPVMLVPYEKTITCPFYVSPTSRHGKFAAKWQA
jgi:hypothetical protein